ncbi:MAG: glycoside hydrolase family 13 protein [Actinomycetales bacterium]|nr:glycoside hydrolase family 13 protein [Actinomycetales bacterium]
MSEEQWWHDAVVYQVYVRSFRDADGDGIGDLAGIRAELDHLVALGVDALWLNPCYVSPQRDHGYDIADYRAIDPAYGDVGELEALVQAAGKRGIRVVMDMVANHCSTEHAWFREALAAEPGSRERARFLFRDGRGAHGELPPNNWQSVFGGPAWTRVTDADGRPGQWYLHSFDPGQPDFDWRNPEVAAEFDAVLEFWFARGVAGFRIDVAHGMVKADGLPDWPGADTGEGGHNAAMWDQPEVHAIYRRWRAVGRSAGDPERYLVGEIWVPSAGALRAYLRDDELHQAFSFDLLVQPWDAGRQRAAIERALDLVGERTPPAWTLSNHDVHRTVTRYGQAQDLGDPDPSDMIAAARRRGPVDLALGIRRARAAAALQLFLPGAVYLYQGEELGLPEVLGLPDDARQDPIWVRSGGAELGRDGCRVPLPWRTDPAGAHGFSPAGAARSWLPQPAWFADFAAERQRDDPESTLGLYRRLVALRHEMLDGAGPVEILDLAAPDVLALRRGDVVCLVNFAAASREVAGFGAGRLLAATAPESSGAEAPEISGPETSVADVLVVPADSAVWLVAARLPAGGDLPTTRAREGSSTPFAEVAAQ